VSEPLALAAEGRYRYPRQVFASFAHFCVSFQYGGSRASREEREAAKGRYRYPDRSSRSSREILYKGNKQGLSRWPRSKVASMYRFVFASSRVRPAIYTRTSTIR